MSSSNHFPVAIVGVAAELPSGSWSQRNLDYNSFYDFLLQGGEAYEKIPLERFSIHKLKGTAPGQVVTDTGAFLKAIDLFDPVEFGVTSKDARLMSLGTRKLLETTFLALLDSGIDYRGRNVGCYMSAVAHDIFAISGHDDTEARGAFSYTPAMVANRVSYHLDLRGPTVPLDTACSSTLYATHFAVQALRNGECESAVVGGCQLNHRFAEWLLYSQGGILSPDGKCKPFDISANGFGRGEAVVSIVLKPLDAALRDRDGVYATILGTGINSSGSLAPVNAPVASAQQDAMLRAFGQAQRSPGEVDFIELHATGTASGDPTEANWVGDQFKRDGELLVGSVKGNIGHTEITAFLSSLCKVCHIIEHGVIPPTVNFTVPNPAIHWAEHRMRVPVTPEKLSIRSPSGRALIAMSSSGIGGANGHCVIEAYSSNPDGFPRMWACESSTVPSLLLACGLSPRAATAVGESIKGTHTDQDRKRISLALGRRARSMVWRSYSVVSDGQVPRFSEPILVPKAAPEIVFVFSGQGPQHWNMGRELFKSCVPFRETVVELDQVYAGVTGKSLISDIGLFGEGDVADPLGDVWPISVTLPALAILQIALVDTLATIGVKPTAVVGHSAGETAVIYASGTASKAMAVELAIARGRAMELLEQHDGTMAALACSSVQAEKIIAAVIAELGPAPLEVGCLNAPNAVTLSGSTTHVVSAVRRAKAAGILATRLRTKVPVHSSMMSLCQAEYEERVGKVFSKHAVGPMKVEVFSTLTGNLLNSPHDPLYFWENTAGPVMFESAMKAIHARYQLAVFVELGPHPVLSGYISEIVGQGTMVLSPLKRSKSVDVGDVTPFMDFVGRLVCAGYSSVDMDVLCGSTEDARTSLPPYPLARKQVPYVAPTFEITRQRQVRYGPLNYPQLQINTQTHPELADHIIKHEPIMPAAGFLEMALEFGAKRLWDVNFHSMLSLSSERPTPVHVQLEGSKWSVRSASALDFSLIWPPAYHRLHATGYLSMCSEADTDIRPVPLSDIRARLQKLEMKNFYDSLASFANYGPTYRRVLSCYHGVDRCGLEELLVEIRGAANDLDNLSYYCLHPAILDAALHVAVHPLITGAITDGRYYLPSRVGALTIHDALERGIPDRIYAYGVFVSWTPDSLTYDFKITNGSGLILCSIEALEVVAHGQAPLAVQNRYEVIYHQLNIRVPTPIDDGSVSARARKVVVFDNTPKDRHNGLQIFQYRRGHEMDLQQGIRKLSAIEEEALCFIASEGMDGDAVLGFTRSLRKEYHSWRVFCVVFPSARPLHEHEEAARSLCAHPLAEEEMFVYVDGSVHAARVAPSSAPRRMAHFDRAMPWAHVKGTISQVPRPAMPLDHVLVHITGLSPRISSCQTFVGHVGDCPGVHIGITFGPLANYAIAHRGSISELAKSPGADCSPDGLAIVIAVLAIGHARFNDPSRLRGSCILVTHSETSTGRNICRLYESRGFRVIRLPSQAGAREAKTVLDMKPKFIVSGREREAEDDVDNIVYELQPGKIFQWDDPSTGVAQVMAEDPWAIGDALKLVLSLPADSSIKSVSPIELLNTALPVEVPVMSTIFDPDKAYILVGGIGGLGLPIAYWMYNNGAREIVLTSRGGVMKLGTREEFIAFRLLHYLQSQADLVLRTEAVEASSIEQTKRLVDSITKPIGGCMILAAVLSDRTFSKHTSETFEMPYTSKLGAFDALERALNIDSLDFLLAYSSIAGLAGNAGQTNYSSANTALTGLTRRYRNSATLVPPMVNDTGFFLNMAATDSIQWSRYRHLNACAMTCYELCECIGEALLKLREGPLWQYIPDYNWGLVQNNLGSSPLYDYLVTKQSSSDVDQISADEPQCTLSDIICDVLDIDHEDLSPDVPLTSYGLDSLSATALSHALAPYLTVSQLQLLADVTLAHLEQLREELSSATTPEAASIEEEAVTAADVDGPTKLKAEEMMVLLRKYSSDLPSRAHAATARTKRIILLTGSTGSVGSHVLAHLLSHSSSYNVFALVRRDPSGMSPIERLMEVFKARELDASSLMSHKLTALEGDMTMPTFGLSAAVYQDLLQSVTHVVHLAWPIDFVTPLSALEPHIRGMRYLIDFAASSAAQVKFLFSSTAGMFRRLPDRKPMAEVLVTDPLVAVGSGYSESKWVAERLISIAGEKHIFSPTIVRLGQLSGSARNGVWRTSEWIPSMVSASVALGCLPDARGDVSWLPVDAAAAALADLVDCPADVLHLCHPRPVTWREVFAHFALVLALPLVPYADWIVRLERGLSLEAAAPRGLEHGLRLLEIFRSAADADEPTPDVMGKIVPRVDITHALVHSAALREGTLPQIGREDVRRWIEYWRREGFLPPEGAS
ncbi:ketoacyl-synt-domain-containing protein [Daedalea quercina L-15889]|uniref:Ketoacyl-synt-domain-containing protein n=1 Tax=Daedalea quercina L-15889 TaxID=1314783 RepID=A0A165RTB1_9APHY|nr:ketoacyl-synt-domain-containing protein [Daedalea quercina L-15889]